MLITNSKSKLQFLMSDRVWRLLYCLVCILYVYLHVSHRFENLQVNSAIANNFQLIFVFNYIRNLHEMCNNNNSNFTIFISIYIFNSVMSLSFRFLFEKCIDTKFNIDWCIYTKIINLIVAIPIQGNIKNTLKIFCAIWVLSPLLYLVMMISYSYIFHEIDVLVTTKTYKNTLIIHDLTKKSYLCKEP